MSENFYKDKKVFITGHTGFKGSWLSRVLLLMGAKVKGYSLGVPTYPSLFQILDVQRNIESITDGDIRNLNKLNTEFKKFKPDIVFHLAAQPIVRNGYENPVYTYETNVIGTVNILECIRINDCTSSFLNITTDKVYFNNEWDWGYRENDLLNGFDPYSNSKSCSELATSTYRNSFFNNTDISISTARSGNVIGGGDFANDRIIPDCIRSIQKNKPIIIRNKFSIRPYQHVLNSIYAYLIIANKQFNNKAFESSYNVGPNEQDYITTGNLVSIFCSNWGGGSWTSKPSNDFHEASVLKLDCSKIKEKLGWIPYWSIDCAIEKTVDWFKCYFDSGNIKSCTDEQIKEFFKRTEFNV